MPNKYPEKKGWNVPKQKHKLNNWRDYNQHLRDRGRIELWISEDAIANWYEPERVYDGNGAPNLYTDFAIIACHEVRQWLKLPLRQCQGFLDSLFEIRKLDIKCPDYTSLSKRLATLGLKCPKYKKTDKPDDDLAAIAIDSTGLKRFGRDEWHQEKHKISGKRSWRKLHIAVGDDHIIHAASLTDRFVADESAVDDLVSQIETEVEQVTADGAYDSTAVYEKLETAFPNADIVIPPVSGAVCLETNHALRNRNVLEIKEFGRMTWQRERRYGKRNNSELGIQRYKRILGNKMHARELSRQKNEAIIGCGILNKMTQLGMPASYRSVCNL